MQVAVSLWDSHIVHRSDNLCYHTISLLIALLGLGSREAIPIRPQVEGDSKCIYKYSNQDWILAEFF